MQSEKGYTAISIEILKDVISLPNMFVLLATIG